MYAKSNRFIQSFSEIRARNGEQHGRHSSGSMEPHAAISLQSAHSNATRTTAATPGLSRVGSMGMVVEKDAAPNEAESGAAAPVDPDSNSAPIRSMHLTVNGVKDRSRDLSGRLIRRDVHHFLAVVNAYIADKLNVLRTRRIFRLKILFCMRFASNSQSFKRKLLGQ